MDYLANLFIWTFFLFGIYEFFRTIILDFLKKRKNTYLLVVVKDGENFIEGQLRLEILKNKFLNGNYISKILVVDMNSNDNTYNIIENLSKENKIIKLVNLEELTSILNV